MNINEAMKELESYGSEQTRKTYRNHGATGDLFGVSFASMGKLKRKIKVDQELAEKLWATGNLDARTLATMVADPETIKASTLDAWSKTLTNRGHAALLSNIAAEARSALERMKRWTKSRNEFISCAGWHVLASLARADNDLPDSLFIERIEQIEASIHDERNWVKYAMNNALISTGTRNAKLTKKATAAAKRIGAIKIDHGVTSCKTPDAVSHIRKAVARSAEKKAKQAGPRARSGRARE